MQFESAIVAYKLGRLVESITLAGAAELILGQMCNLKKEIAAIDSYVKGAKKRDVNLVDNKFKDYLNKHRNWLKHFNENDIASIEINEDDAKAMLVRATINYLRLGINPTRLINEFINELT